MLAGEIFRRGMRCAVGLPPDGSAGASRFGGVHHTVSRTAEGSFLLVRGGRGLPSRSVIEHTSRERHGSRSRYVWSNVVTPATRPDAITATPRISAGKVPGSVSAYPWVVRARAWRNRRHEEPVLSCDCDLRFSFP